VSLFHLVYASRICNTWMACFWDSGLHEPGSALDTYKMPPRAGDDLQVRPVFSVLAGVERPVCRDPVVSFAIQPPSGDGG
jgi:hypothetical protein